MNDTYDYVVVGGGSSGCVVAAQLAADPSLRVLLLERGEPAEQNPETLAADGYKYAFANDRLILERFTAPQKGCGGRRLFAGTGMGMGGSGSVNAMVYTRGSKLDYAEWPEGHRWDDLLPDFEAVEQKLRPRPRPPTRFTEAAISAAEAAGFRRKADLDDGDLSGVLGYERMNYEGDSRRSAYVSFLREPGVPANLTVQTSALVHRVDFDAARRATGVRYEVGGQVRTALVRREVVLCAGALETPKILLLSGIGPAPHLRSMGVDVVLDQPEIGQNLHDHPNVACFHVGKQETDCAYPQLYGFHRAGAEMPLPPDQSDTCYVFYTARSSLHQMTLRMLPALVLPPRLYEVDRVKGAIRWAVDRAFGLSALNALVRRIYGVVVILGKPQSRGSLRLASRDPAAYAHIDPAYFADPRDLEAMVSGVRLARRIAGAPALSAWGNTELSPGPWARSDAALARFVRANAMTTYHFAGTCRMGPGAPAPVDTRLRLRGVTGVRVADASVVPTVPVSALNAPSMMIGHRASRYILEEARASARPVSENSP